MTITAQPRRSAGSTRAVDAARRGRLVLADTVVEKIAAQAASEVAGSSGRAGGLLGIGGHSDPTARPKVDVTLSADSADLAIEVGIAYPTSIRGATQRIREHVSRRVQDLTGVAVHRVDIDVTWLTLDDTNQQRGLA